MKDLSANIWLLWYDDDQEDLEYFKLILDELKVSKYVLCYEKEDFYNHTNSDINLVITDHMLPGTSGLEVLKQVKEQNECNYVMIVTGTDSPYVIIEYLNNGADHFILKGDKDYREKLEHGVRVGFTKAQERIEHAKQKAEWAAKKDHRLTEHAKNLIDLIDRGTT